MSQHSDEYNALPIEQRALLNALMIEAEIRLIEAEKRRTTTDYRAAILAHDARIKCMRRSLACHGQSA